MAERRLIDAVAAIAREAGDIAFAKFGTDYKRWEKAPGNPVCAVDLVVDGMLRDRAWMQAAIAFQQKDAGAVAKLPLPQALAAISRGAGIDRIVAAQGLPAARVPVCLADQKEQDRLGAMAKEAWETRHIPGTPAFLINGALAEGVTSWATMDAKIKDALK